MENFRFEAVCVMNYLVAEIAAPTSYSRIAPTSSHSVHVSAVYDNAVHGSAVHGSSVHGNAVHGNVRIRRA